MQNQRIVQFMEKVDKLIPDTQTKSNILPLIFGIAIGSFTKANVDTEINTGKAFSDLYTANIQRAISLLNEHSVLDTNRTHEVARAMHTYRSLIAQGKPIMTNLNGQNPFIFSAFGINDLFTDIEVETLNQLGATASNILQNALLLISDLLENRLIQI